MTARNSLKRLIRARMRKTGESYSSARRYFHAEGNKMTNATTELQPDLWPDWVEEHPRLVSFLAKAEAEARNRGDTRCDHFHMELAFLGLGPPVPDWFQTLGLEVRRLREDTVDILGTNATFGDPEPEDLAELGQMLTPLQVNIRARGRRALGSRNSDDPVNEFPLASVDDVYTGELLALAQAEAKLHGGPIDERHLLIALAMLLFEGSPPAASALRYLTGLSPVEDTSFDVRIGDREWTRALAASHGGDPTKFPYDIEGPRD